MCFLIYVYMYVYIYNGFCIETVDLPMKSAGNGESSSELPVQAIQHLYHEAPTLPLLRLYFALPGVAVNKAQKNSDIYPGSPHLSQVKLNGQPRAPMSAHDSLEHTKVEHPSMIQSVLFPIE